MRKFTNPYHFVPLEKGCSRNVDFAELVKEDNLRTGWIECRLETLTPVFIPNTLNDDFFETRESNGNGSEIEIKSYDFYSHTDNRANREETGSPVIPGSSLRGPIRAAFEALTNSCLSTTDDDHVLFKRVTTPAKNPGRLIRENGEWKIVECEKYGIAKANTRNDPNNFSQKINQWHDGTEVHFTIGGSYLKENFKTKKMFKIFDYVGSIDTQPWKGAIKGYLHKGEPFGRRKHHESVFVETRNAFPVPEKAVVNLLENYKLYQDETVNLHKKQEEHDGYSSNLRNAESAAIDKLAGTLVYYQKHSGRYYLCPAAIGREVFHNRLRDLLGEGVASYSPCTDNSRLCPACALFGFAGNSSGSADDKKRNALASRVGFTDARLEPGTTAAFSAPVILPELAGPKPSATEMYLKKPGGLKKTAAIWNYDYACSREGGKLKDIPGYKPKIQGRKFYWHHKQIKTFAGENRRLGNNSIPFSDRLVQVRPLASGNSFNFKVHFNRLSPAELDRLVWVLSLGGNPDLAHKIGMGKPVGLGSVRIEIKEIKLRRLALENGVFDYTFITKDWLEGQGAAVEKNLGCSETTLKAFKQIADFKSCPDDIAYPYCKDERGRELAEHYHWFVGNKRILGSGGTGTTPVIEASLPPLPGDPKLPVIIKNRNSYALADSGRPGAPASGQRPENRHRRRKTQGKKPEIKKIEKPEIKKIDRITKSLSQAKKAKEVKKILTGLKSGELSPAELQRIESQLKKRPDAAQRRNNPQVEGYFQVLESLKEKTQS